MAAGEDQLEALVLDHGVFDLIHGRLGNLELARLLGQPPLAADPIDRSVARGHDQPGSRVGQQALPRPALGGDRERLLNGLLGAVKVAEETDQRGENSSPLLAKDALEGRQRQCSTIGRTSTEPWFRAAGIRDAASIASSRLPASRM